MSTMSHAGLDREWLLAVELDDLRDGRRKRCECGCGEPTPICQNTDPRRGYKRGEPHRFISGHNRRGAKLTDEQRATLSIAHRVPHPGKRKPNRERSKTNSHRWARLIKQAVECELQNIGGCKGRLEIHHRDGDPWNNDEQNLIALCKSHHVRVHRSADE